MNLDKYSLPNFFIHKRKKPVSGTYNLSGNVFYIPKQYIRDDYTIVETAWSINIDYPGGSKYIHRASKSVTTYHKNYFEQWFYHVNELDLWKKEAMIRAIFAEKNEDIINEI